MVMYLAKGGGRSPRLVRPFVKNLNLTVIGPSSIEHGGYQHIFQFDGNVGPLECIFVALLPLFNDGVPAHFFHLMEAPTMRLPNVKILLRWPSKMHIYGFVGNHTFLEKFVSMGVPVHFPI